MRYQRAVALFGAAALVTIMVLSGCGDNPLTPEQVVGGNDTVFVVNPPDTTGGGRDTLIIIVPQPGTNCGEVRLEPFNVTRSTPLKYIGSYYFSGQADLRLFIRVDNYRVGGGHNNQNIQFYAVRDGDGQKVVLARPGDDCGVLADTSITGAATRYVGQATLPAGTWAVYALHASQVSCFAPTGSGNGPVSVQDGQLEWCYRK